MLTTFRKRSGTITRPAMVLDHGEPVPDWPAGETIVVPRCVVQPAMGLEDESHRDAVERRYDLFAPADTDLRATDRFTFAGTTYEVQGQPLVYDEPGSSQSYLQAILRRLDG